MAFKKSAIVTEYTWPVTLKIPNAGQYDTVVFRARFALPTGEEMESIQEEMQARKATEISLCRRFWRGWVEGDVQDDDGNPLPEARENMEHFLSLPYFRQGLMDAYIESQHGRKAAIKN